VYSAPVALALVISYGKIMINQFTELINSLIRNKQINLMKYRKLLVMKALTRVFFLVDATGKVYTLHIT